MLLLMSADFFEIIFHVTIRVVYGLDQDQD